MAQSLPTHPNQAEVVVYTKDYCPYCTAAKNLLTQKGVSYREIDVQDDEAQYQEMLKRASPRRTVPQIFIGGQGVGGFDDIKRLDGQGDLDKILFPKGK
jgi:glutaredoxin 3